MANTTLKYGGSEGLERGDKNYGYFTVATTTFDTQTHTHTHTQSMNATE